MIYWYIVDYANRAAQIKNIFNSLFVCLFVNMKWSIGTSWTTPIGLHRSRIYSIHCLFVCLFVRLFVCFLYIINSLICHPINCGGLIHRLYRNYMVLIQVYGYHYHVKLNHKLINDNEDGMMTMWYGHPFCSSGPLWNEPSVADRP